MFDGLGTFVTGATSNAQSALLLPFMGAGILIGAFQYMTGNHQGGRQWVTWSLGGGAIGLLATSIATSAKALIH